MRSEPQSRLYSMLPISGRLMGCNHAETGATETYKQRRDPTVTNVFTRKTKAKREPTKNPQKKKKEKNQQPETEWVWRNAIPFNIERSIIPNRPTAVPLCRKRKPKVEEKQ